MKITLTLAEITALVINHFRLPSDTEVEIKHTGALDVQRILNGMYDFYTGQPILVNGEVPPDKKIPAIKALRTVVPGLGLGDAKRAVENWYRFISYVSKNGLPPVTDFRWDE